MPIRPENRGRYPAMCRLTCDNGRSKAGPRANGTRPLTHSLDYTEEGLAMEPTHRFRGRLDDVLAADEHAALLLMRDRFGIDAARTYQFWEHATARLIDGTTTPANCPWDVETGPIRVEVKFSREFTTRFRVGARQVFRWTALVRDEADVTVLFGIDNTDGVYLWVAPSRALRNTATVISPRAAIGETRSPLDRWHVPLDQLLPVVLRHYDRDHHAQTRAATVRAEAAVLAGLFDLDTQETR